MTTTEQTERAQAIWDFVIEHTNAGRRIFFTTATRTTYVDKKHVDRGLVRLNGAHVEVARGKAWDSIIFCKITAGDK